MKQNGSVVTNLFLRPCLFLAPRSIKSKTRGPGEEMAASLLQSLGCEWPLKSARMPVAKQGSRSWQWRVNPRLLYVMVILLSYSGVQGLKRGARWLAGVADVPPSANQGVW
jgi:hypothetical protein